MIISALLPFVFLLASAKEELIPPPLVKTVTPLAKQVDYDELPDNENTIAVQKIGLWHIRVDKSLNAGCYAYAAYTDSTGLRVALNPQADVAMLVITNPYWRSLSKDAREPIHILMSGGQNWDGDGEKFNSTANPGLIMKITHEDFLPDLMASKWIAFDWYGRHLARLELRDIKQAVEAIVECQKVVDEAVDPFATPPFKKPETG